MSNISRRDFLKTAGVMTLAVAAAGVLAGCEGSTAPAPEAGKPEVTTNSVSYTGLYGDKLTVESVGRFNVYDNLDKETLLASQTLLKVTYTKPQTTTVQSVELTEITLENGNTAAVVASADIATKYNAKISAKTGVEAADIVDLAGLGTALAAQDYYEVTKYILLDSAKIVTNDLKVLITYKPTDSKEVKDLTLPLAVTVNTLY